MATIKDVARMADVSLATVSKYLNGGNLRPENTAAIADAIARLDYRVNPHARGLKNQAGSAVGILLPDMSAPFFGTIVTAIDRVLREQGIHTLIACYGADHGLEREKLTFLLSTGIRGLIYAPENLSSEEFAELTALWSIPTVQMDRMIPGVECDAVLVDNTDAAYHGVAHLIEKGHTRIAAITGPKSVFSAKERLVGYLRALSDHGLLYDDTLVISKRNDFATGYRGFEALMALESLPTAVFTANYDITMGLATAARERGCRIPEDLDIVGFDCGDIFAMMHPPLPVMQQPEQEIGKLAAEYLLSRMGGNSEPPRTTRLQCKMVPDTL